MNCFVGILWIFVAAIGSDLTHAQGSAPYFGLPVGAMHYTADATKGDVYAADPRTLMIVNFRHHPKTPGCTTFMAGPLPSSGDFESDANGEGVLLPLRSAPQAETFLRRKKRSKFSWDAPQLSFLNPNFHPLDSPFEFANLRLPNDRASAPQSNAEQQDAFAGIQLEVGPEPDHWFPQQGAGLGPITARPTIPPVTRLRAPATPKPKMVPIADLLRQKYGAPSSTTQGSWSWFGNTETTTAASEPARAARKGLIVFQEEDEVEPVLIEAVPKTAFRRIVTRRPTTTKTPVTTTARPTTTTTTTTTTEQSTTEATTTTVRSTTTTTVGTTTEDLSKAEAQREPELRLTVLQKKEELAPPPVAQSLDLNSVVHSQVPKNDFNLLNLRFFPAMPPGHSNGYVGTGLLFLDPDDKDHSELPEVASPFLGPLPRYPELYERFNFPIERVEPETTVEPTTPTTEEPTTQEPESRVIYLGAESAPEEPVDTTAEEQTTILSESQPPETTEASTPTGSTEEPLFYVVKDVRAERRRFLASRLSEIDNAESGDQPQPLPQSYALKPVPKEVKPPKFPVARHGESYALPDVVGDTLVVELREPYRLTDFKWFGVYDHCKQFRTAHVTLEDVRAPQEAVIEGIAGWQYETSSEDIVVMNCNTLLIRGFRFLGGRETASYFYVGVGDFPKEIHQHIRALVVGKPANSPLENYDNEDVLVRLPIGWKTFDVNFLSVYNPSEHTSYGHTSIPPLVVPPCEDIYNDS